MKIQVSLIQDSPVFFDTAATIQKMRSLIAREADNGARLIIFPESFVPGYPRGFDFGAVVGSRSDEGRVLYARYRSASITIEGPEMQLLIEDAASLDVYVVFGFTEKLAHNGSLYCSMAYLSPSAGLMAVHRKIKPTGTERLVWAEAGPGSLVAVETKIGRLGGLICWENYMPLARMSMYRHGVQIYVAPTADSRESWLSTMKHIALEGRCYVLSCNQYFTKSMYPADLMPLVSLSEEEICPGGSVIIDPLGNVVSGPLSSESGSVTATIDLSIVDGARLDFDVDGHYSRNDIFDLKIHGLPNIIRE